MPFAFPVDDLELQEIQEAMGQIAQGGKVINTNILLEHLYYFARLFGGCCNWGNTDQREIWNTVERKQNMHMRKQKYAREKAHHKQMMQEWSAHLQR